MVLYTGLWSAQVYQTEKCFKVSLSNCFNSAAFASNDRNTYYGKEGGGGVHEFHMVSQQHNNSSGFSDARLAKVCDKFD